MIKENKLLDHVLKVTGLKNDAVLCRKLETAAPVMSKIRHGQTKVGATLIIRIHELTGMSVKEIKELAGV
jgi:hypothetical protein